MNTNDYTIRLENEKDHRAVENLVRESFWNVYKPGCSEHYVIHVLREYIESLQSVEKALIEAPSNNPVTETSPGLRLLPSDFQAPASSFFHTYQPAFRRESRK